MRLSTESPYGGLRQTLNTTVGQQYLFSLDASNSGATETVTVDGSPIQLSAGPSFVRGSTLWTTETGSFTARGPQTVLDIVGTGSAGSFNLFVDNVSATTAVPEPATWLLLTTGLPILLGYGWRKQQKKKGPGSIYSDSPNNSMQPTRYARRLSLRRWAFN